MDLRGELLTFLTSSDVPLPEDFDEDTPLLSSGTLDSLTLFNLVLWIEEKTGRSIDPTRMDIVRAWDSVRRILDYVEGDAVPVAPPPAPAPAGGGAGRIRIVPYAVEHEDAVARLQAGLWGPDVAMNRRYLEWKYEESPVGDGPRLYLAFDGDELVAMRGFYPSRWQVGKPSREVDLLVADDNLVREDHRDRGLVGAIMRTALEDLRPRGGEYVLNLSGGPTTVVGSLAMGWRSVGSLRAVGVRSAAQRRRAATRRLLSGLPLVWRYEHAPRLTAETERRPLARFDAHLGAARVGDEVLELSATPRVEAMAALVERLGHDGRLRHVRDEAFLSWRFRHPSNRYRFVYAGGDPLAGYLVLKWSPPRRGPNPRVHIVDLEATDERVCRALLDGALRAGRFPEVATWRATLPPPVGRTLDRAGFRPVDQERAVHGVPCVLVRPLDDARLAEDWTLHGMRLLDLANWDVRMLYTMAG